VETTNVFSKLLKAYIKPENRVIVMRGGTRSGKTFAILQLLNIIALKTNSKRVISVVAETLPQLKRGAIRDFKTILENENIYNSNAWHDTDKIYRYDNAMIEFFSAMDAGRVHGLSRDILFVNEATNLEWEIYRQLAVRTTEKIIIDYNPIYEFWVDSKLLPRADVELIDSTYLDNDMLSSSQIAEIESNREIDPDWWNVYGLGKIGSKQGLIIKNWDIVREMPPRSEWKKAYIGVDFGWSNPTAVMLVVLSGGEVYIDELAYQSNLDNPEIVEIIKENNLQRYEIIADPADPRSKSELRNGGLRVPDKIVKDIGLGIRVMNRYKKHYTERSVNSIDENRKYRYSQDKDGNYTGEPIDKFNHAKDAERYVFLNRLSNISAGFDVTVSTTK